MAHPAPSRSRALAAASALALALAAACGGAEPERSPSKAPGKGAAKASGGVEALEVEGLLRLFPEDQTLFHLGAKKRPMVDRHKSPNQLARESYGNKNRDSRRAVTLRPRETETWTSPVLRVPRRAKLLFSTVPVLEDLGARVLGLSWTIRFEVPGAAGRGASVQIWRKDEVLRPPTGGDWSDEEVDLRELAGREGRFVFAAARYRDSPELPPGLVAAYGNAMVVAGKDERPNLLVISIDTLRRDALSPYAPDKQTPNVQHLADRGVVAENCWSTAPWTLPSYASLFTGEYPSTHGAGVDRTIEIKDDGMDQRVGVAQGVPSLVSHFARNGYLTQAFYSNGHLHAESGLARGFDGYVWYGVTGRTSADLFDGWLRTVSGRPFAAFVQMIDPHWPYAVPHAFAKKVPVPDTSENASFEGKPAEMFKVGVPEGDRAQMSEVYDILVRYMDEQVGLLLDVLERQGFAEDTLVVFHSDHGEELWDHGEWWHGHTHYSELVHVPLILSWPGHLPEGTRVEETVRSVDVLPSALELLGLPGPEHVIEGRSLAALFRGESGVSLRPALSEAELYGPGGDFALTEYPWRLIVQPRTPWNSRELWEEDPASARGGELVMLFNLADDPRETHDLAEVHPERVADMRARGEEILARAAERKVGESPVHEGVDDQDALEMLGYAGS